MNESCPHPASPPAEIARDPSRPTTGRTDAPGPARSVESGWQGQALAYFSNPVAHMSSLRRTYGDVVRLVQGGNPPLLFRSSRPDRGTYFVFGPKYTRTVLTRTEVFETRRPRGPECAAFDRMTTNMFFINGDRHRQQRRLFMPAFTRESLKAYYQDMVRFTSEMLAQWHEGEQIDLDHEMHRVTLNISSKSLYGIDATERENSLADQMSDMLDTLFSPATMETESSSSAQQRLVRQIEQTVEQLEREIASTTAAGAQGDDVLSMMIRAHRADPSCLTDDEMIGQAFTIFFAGHDTAAKALTWTLFLLAQHPREMAELAAELKQRLDGRPPTFQEVYGLPVLDRVIKESLRVLTPAVVFARMATRDTSLGGYDIPAGSEVIYSPYMVHVDPAVFPQPRVFKPSRWLDIKPGTYEYLPFGAGARTCIGNSFGGLQLRLMIAMIVQRWRLETVANTRIDIKTNVVISPEGGLPMTVREMDGRFEQSRQPVRGFIREMVDFLD